MKYFARYFDYHQIEWIIQRAPIFEPSIYKSLEKTYMYI